jgi:hypothetical protein
VPEAADQRREGIADFAAGGSIVELWDFGVLADIAPPVPGEVVSQRKAYSEAGE